MKIHSCHPILWSKVWVCDACNFRGFLADVIQHVVRNQYVVPR